MAALFSQWPSHPHRNPRREHARATNLLKALKVKPKIKVEWCGVTVGCASEQELEDQPERAREALDVVRAAMFLIGAERFDNVMAYTVRHFPSLADEIREAAGEHIKALKEAEQVLLFLLDVDVDEEWLPEAPEPADITCSSPAMDIEL